MPPLLRLRGLAKSYDGNVVLTGIDLDLEPGEILALVGENGAGKSTLMRIVGGYAAPSTGEVTYDGSSRPGTVSRLRPIDESSGLIGGTLSGFGRVGRSLEGLPAPLERSASERRPPRPRRRQGSADRRDPASDTCLPETDRADPMMHLSLVTDVLGDLPFEDMLDTVAALGFEGLELGCGNWSKAPHLDLDALLDSEAARTAFLDHICRRGLFIAALNCSGNQLHPGESGKRHAAVVEKTFRLAEQLGVDRVVMMSGLPGGGPRDEVPNWITHVILPEDEAALDYQWNACLVPYFQKAAVLAKDCGIRIAIENLGHTMIHNPANMLRLREHVDPVVGMNFDPSHHFWMGGDPVAALRLLGDAIHHMHAKDVRLERTLVEANGLIDVHRMDEIAKRSWNYVALGHGHDVQYWKEFFAVARLVGYDGPVSLELEDMSMEPLTGVKKSLQTLKLALPRDLESTSEHRKRDGSGAV